MKAIAKAIRFGLSINSEPEITLTLKGNIQDLQAWNEELKDLAEMDVEVKKHRKKRSLDANAYLWVLLSKMAAVLRTTKDELYLLMLERYGAFTHLIVKKNVVERVKEEWRTVRELGEVTIGKQQGVQLQCYFGSSTYDTKEMSVLIDGIVSEAKELGIETATPAELELMKSEWGRRE